jgi:hypothetical protein
MQVQIALRLTMLNMMNVVFVKEDTILIIRYLIFQDKFRIVKQD